MFASKHKANDIYPPIEINISIFVLLESRDQYLIMYQSQLADRLLENNSIGEQHEMPFIKKLQQEGADVKAMERMI